MAPFIGSEGREFRHGDEPFIFPTGLYVSLAVTFVLMFSTTAISFFDAGKIVVTLSLTTLVLSGTIFVGYLVKIIRSS